MTTTTTNTLGKVTLTGDQMKVIKGLIKGQKIQKNLPILNNVKIDVTNGMVKAIYQTEKLSIVATLGETNIINQHFLIPLQTVKNTKFIKKDSFYELEIKDENTIIFNNSGIRQTIKTDNVDDYPKDSRARVEPKQTGELTRNDLVTLKKAMISISQVQTRPILHHILLRNGLFASTDSHRMYQGKAESEVLENDVIFYNELVKTVISNEKEVGFHATFEQGENYVIISTKNTVFTYVQDDVGNYPQLERLIPVEFRDTFTIQDVDFLKSIAQNIGNLVNETRMKGIVALELKDQNTLVLSGGSEESGKIREEIEISNSQLCKHNTFKISFSSNFLLGAIEQVSDKGELEFNFSGAMRPFTITNTSNDDLALVLPVRVF